jgi:hypothetical protein
VFGVIVLFLGVAIAPSTGFGKESLCLINDSTKYYNSIQESETDGINITLNGTIGENGWYISCVNISVTVSHNVENIWYRFNNESWNDFPGFYLVICEDGKWILQIKYEDITGNITFGEKIPINIDKTKPIVSEYLIERIGRSKHKFTVICSDVTSGINRTEFFLDWELWYTDFDEPYEWISGYGPGHFYFIHTYDNAGNVKDSGFSFPSEDNTFKGLILNPQITEKNITFFAIFALSRGVIYPWIGIHIFQWVTYRNDFTGYIGKYWIDVVFHH